MTNEEIKVNLLRIAQMANGALLPGSDMGLLAILGALAGHPSVLGKPRQSDGSRENNRDHDALDVRWHLRLATSLEELDKMVAEMRMISGAKPKTRKQWEESARIRRSQLERLVLLQQDQANATELMGGAK